MLHASLPPPSLLLTSVASGAGKTQIAVFYYNPSPYGIASWKAAQVEAKKLGVQVTGFDGNNNPELQTTQMEDAITTGKYKAFWVWALNGVAEAPTIKQAEAKGIKVAVADYTLGDLNSELTLSPTKGLVSTIGGSIGKQEQAFATLIQLACKKQVGRPARATSRSCRVWPTTRPTTCARATCSRSSLGRTSTSCSRRRASTTSRRRSGSR